MTMSKEELATIQGVDEGIENRIKATAKIASSFQNWVEAIKTKRYTWTRIQRMFVHILTNTKKTEIEMISQDSSVPYVRVIGLTNNGRNYLNQQKKQMNVPIVSSIGRNQHNILSIEEKVSNTYYSILPPKSRQKLFKQELQAPIIL
jgi:predicted nucleotidyltransferase